MAWIPGTTSFGIPAAVTIYSTGDGRNSATNPKPILVSARSTYLVRLKFKL